MFFFLDTASLKQIQIWKKINLVDGVTTNPTLLSKEGLEPIDQLKAICKLVNGPVSAQVTEIKAEKMIKQAYQLKKISNDDFLNNQWNRVWKYYFSLQLEFLFY